MAASSNEIRTAVALIRLATGERDTDWTSLAWRDVASLAVRERCIALAWLRSSETIANHADAEVVAWWRDLAVRTLARGHAHLATLRTLADSMARAGVQCVILKGAPLSAMLHGEPGARTSADLDVWIPLGDRPRARAALLEDGWQYADGAAPDDEAFTRPGAHGEEYLEVHSNLLHGRLDYLPMPDPEYSEVSVAGSVLPVMTGSLLPAYLAVHIARHQIAPLVWLIDHRALWGRLDDDARSLARWTAQRCGVHRYLAWVLRRTALLDCVTDGDPTAVKRLGLLQQRRNLHPMWREIRLAPAPVDAVRAVWAWLMPPWARSGPVSPLEVMRRVRRYWRAAIATTTERARAAGTFGIAAREVTISGEHLLRVVREVSLVGGRVWISTTGTSMLPTLHETDRVLLEPAGRVGVGDVVLIDACGAPLLHRIVRVRGERITTRGDSRMTADATLRREDVIARAVSARRGDREWSLIPRAWLRLRLRARFRRGSGAPEGGLRVGA